MILTELNTLEAAQGGVSLARFGDGELRLAVGGSCSSQRAHPKLQQELRTILAGKTKAMPCIPNFSQTPRKDVWDKYSKPPFSLLYNMAPGKSEYYGSSFITRPDSAPWIDTPEYWAQVRKLWEGKSVVLVQGTDTNIQLPGAKKIFQVMGPKQHAYDSIQQIEDYILGLCGISEPLPVLLSLGATATVLAARLADAGIHALDLGHIWHFMQHAGAYRFSPKDLRSKDYANQLHAKHAKGKWGRDGHSHAAEAIEWAIEISAGKTILDYGCGTGTFAKAFADQWPREIEGKPRVYEYDAGIRGKDHLPKPAQMIVCTDVLEHIEPELIDNVLAHQYALASKGAYFVIALKPARESLPDGRNAHLLVKPPEWWVEKLLKTGWTIESWAVRKALHVWARK